MNVVHMARHISKRIVKEARMAVVSNVRERTEKERKQSSHQAMTVVHHRVINQGVSSTPRSSSLPHLYNIMEQDKTTLQS